MSSNQTRHIKLLKEWSDEKVLTHYGKLNPRGIKDKEKGNAELVRKKLIKKIEKRSKTLAKKVWSELQDKSLVQLKNNLKQTIELDKIHQKETAHKISKMEAKSKGNPEALPPLHIITQTIMGTIITMDIIICMITATTLILITTVIILTILAIIITTTLITPTATIVTIMTIITTLDTIGQLTYWRVDFLV